MAGLLALAGEPALCQQAAIIDSEAHYPEGPLSRAGKLLYVEYSTSNIKIWNGKRSTVFWHKNDCGPSGLIARGDDLLVACYDGNYLVELDASGHEVRVLRTDSSGRPFSGPNDFAADDHGGIYFSASGAYDIKAPITGTVLRINWTLSSRLGTSSHSRIAAGGGMARLACWPPGGSAGSASQRCRRVPLCVRE